MPMRISPLDPTIPVWHDQIPMTGILSDSGRDMGSERRPQQRFLACAGAAVLLLAACNQSGRPPEVASTPAPSATTAALPATVQGTTGIAGDYTVVPGDTVHGVARRFQVPIRNLIDSNGLQPPFSLTPGQLLRIPDQRVHVVAPGETLQDISRQYGVDSSTLVRMNSIEPPYVVVVGQALVLPAPVEPMALAAAPAASLDPQALPGSGAAGTEPSAPGEPVSVPTPTETTGGLGAPPVALPGSGSEDITTSPQPTDPGAATDAGVDAGADPTSGPAGESVATPSETTAPESADAAEPEATQTAAVDPMLIEPAARSSSSFLWPVNGKVVSEFGTAEDGLHNDGINIAAPRGTPVRAAENGVVVYAGNELRGFGNLLLVRHADGFVSAYAHNESLLVERGATVERGQTIARVGSSGSVTSPQLHFELRRGTEAVDPREYLSDLGA
jgi:murein DD-endopeptidase MepM/ murein hydrolase activator NlpD